MIGLVFGSIGTISTFYLIFFLIYWLEHPFFERYKISEDPWPWKGEKREWNLFLRNSLTLIVVNNIITYPFSLLFFGWINDYKSLASFQQKDIPTPFQLFLQIVMFALLEDLIFYLNHRLMHTKLLYPLHKVHHNYTHPIQLATQHAHPLDYLMSFVIPAAAGPLLLGHSGHISTSQVWQIIRLAESQYAHCGYEFSWSPFNLIPFQNETAFHDWHHSSNDGNFATFFSIWDYVFGTNSSYLKHKKRELAL